MYAFKENWSAFSKNKAKITKEKKKRDKNNNSHKPRFL